MAGEPITHRLVARNTARESPNKIHDEQIAKQYGFAGGLVPGVTIFAWMCGPPLDAFGERWLAGGTIDARFHAPVYEDDAVSVLGRPDSEGMDLSVTANGTERAAGRATAARLNAAPSAIPRAEIPAAPPPASAGSLAPGTVLGTLDVRFDAGRVDNYLSSIGARHNSVVDRAHPGWLLVLANLALSSNVALGPWIHVSSEMRLHRDVRDGEPVSTHARVAQEFERKGHRFVDLDVLITAAGRPAASVRHVAIYAPRRPS